jgi:hypothetical protein
VTRLLNPSLGGISSSTTFIKIISDRSPYCGPDLLITDRTECMSRVDSSVIGPTLLLETVPAELVMIIAALLEKETHFCISAGLISIKWRGC